MSSIENTEELPLPTISDEELQRMVSQIGEEGKPLYVATGMSEDQIEALYSVAYNLYNAGKLEDALKIFVSLCMFSHLDMRFWRGLGATAQALKNYEYALQAYAYAAVLDPADPRAIYHTMECQLALKNYPQALAAAEYLDEITAGKPEFAEMEAKAKLVADAIRTNIASQATANA